MAASNSNPFDPVGDTRLIDLQVDHSRIRPLFTPERRLGNRPTAEARRYEQLFALGQGGTAPSHTLAADRYRATRALRATQPLLVDDTWTTGGNAQSAAFALHAAGAAKVALVVIGRHFDRGSGTARPTTGKQKRSDSPGTPVAGNLDSYVGWIRRP